MFRLLLVDDEPYVRVGLKGLIDWNKYGFYICGEAENGIQALDIIQQLDPHLIITDITMPEMDGLELIQRVVCEMKSNSKIIILSGYNEFKFAQKAIQYGVKNYILKPIDEDELIHILIQLRSEIEEEIFKQQERTVSIRAMASETIRKLIKGDCGKDTLNYAKRWLNIEDGKALTFVLLEIADFRNWLSDLDNEQIQSRLSEITRIVTSTLGKENMLNLLEEEVYRYGIIVNSNILGNYHNSIELFCHALYQNIISSTKSVVDIYVGKTVSSIRMCKDSYDSCFYACERKFFEMDTGITFYDKVKDISFNYKLNDNITNISLINSVENGDLKLVQKAIDEIFSLLYKQFFPPAVTKAYIINSMLEVIKFISEKNGDTDRLLMNSRIQDINRFSVDELKEELFKFCIMSAEYIKTLNEKHTPGILEDVVKYIIRNYSKNISLKSIAEYYYINPVYLGQLFKKNYSMYFNEYLNNLRVEEAKKLLASTELKIYEVADKVGYSDSNYFISKFEKIVGVKPTQYRGNK